MSVLSRYFHWLHGKWPAGTVEKLPVVGERGATNVPGVRIVGDLSGVPLLKFSSETGTQALRAILAEPDFTRLRGKDPAVLDVAIIGGGVSGISAAMESAKAGLNYRLYEATQVFSTVANFPKAKPIFTYPTGMTPAGWHPISRDERREGVAARRHGTPAARAAGIEPVIARIERIERSSGAFILHHGDDAKTKTRALRVIVAIGRSGNFRRMDVPGEDLDKVANRLHDPKDFAGKNVLVVGGGDSAAEAAIALAGLWSARHVFLPRRRPHATKAGECRKAQDARGESVCGGVHRAAHLRARDHRGELRDARRRPAGLPHARPRHGAGAHRGGAGDPAARQGRSGGDGAE